MCRMGQNLHADRASSCPENTHTGRHNIAPIITHAYNSNAYNESVQKNSTTLIIKRARGIGNTLSTRKQELKTAHGEYAVEHENRSTHF